MPCPVDSRIMSHSHSYYLRELLVIFRSFYQFQNRWLYLRDLGWSPKISLSNYAIRSPKQVGTYIYVCVYIYIYMHHIYIYTHIHDIHRMISLISHDMPIFLWRNPWNSQGISVGPARRTAVCTPPAAWPAKRSAWRRGGLRKGIIEKWWNM